METTESKANAPVNIPLRAEQTNAARALVADISEAQKALNGYLRGLLIEHGMAEGQWGFSPDLTQLQRNA